MAMKLFITTGSLYQHLARIRKKSGARNNRELLHLLRKTPEHVMNTLRFTPRGREVFALIIEGLTSKGISERLGMGINGIKRHKDKMLLQNDCETMRELIAKYRQAAGENTETDTPQY
jgi:DNA-binding CsgD family transcriptional regulator